MEGELIRYFPLSCLSQFKTNPAARAGSTGLGLGLTARGLFRFQDRQEAVFRMVAYRDHLPALAVVELGEVAGYVHGDH